MCLLSYSKFLSTLQGVCLTVISISSAVCTYMWQTFYCPFQPKSNVKQVKNVSHLCALNFMQFKCRKKLASDCMRIINVIGSVFFFFFFFQIPPVTIQYLVEMNWGNMCFVPLLTGNSKHLLQTYLWYKTIAVHGT